MGISHKNGFALTALATLSTLAVASAGALNGFEKTTAPPTYAAPQVISVGHMENNEAGSTNTILSDVAAGDLILVWGSVYADSATIEYPTVQDSTDGSFTDSTNTYTAAVTTGIAIEDTASEYMSFQAWSAVAVNPTDTLHVRVAFGNYRALNVVIVRGQAVSNYFDDGGTRPYTDSFANTSGQQIIADLPATTFSHCLILTGICWYSSASVVTVNGTWPVVTGRNDGDGGTNRLLTIGKQVTTTGDYNPYVTAPSTISKYASISFIIKGLPV